VKVIDGVNKISSWEVSIDAWFSKDLKIQLWDSVEFLVFGLKQILTVTNIRESQQWSVTPFFYFQVYSDDFEKFPKTYFIATNVASKDIQDFKRDVIEKVWNSASFIEVDEILIQVKSISVKILALIQTLYWYIMLFSFISVIICIRFFKIFQSKKKKLYHTLWAWENTLSKNGVFEYNYLQTIWATIATILASIWSYAILSRSDFIDFTLENYLYSMVWVGIIFILISLFIKYSLRK
jgi:predicted lysophospholipase L1 biosynthesis ABC-type transport system permease subunit